VIARWTTLGNICLIRAITATLSGLSPDRAKDTSTPFETKAGTRWANSRPENVRRSVVGIATEFDQVAATAAAAYADVPAPQITAERFRTRERTFEEATRSSVVGQSSGC
jgi:hypothetical protein